LVSGEVSGEGPGSGEAASNEGSSSEDASSGVSSGVSSFVVAVFAFSGVVVGSEVDFFSSGEDSEGAGEEEDFTSGGVVGPPPPPGLGVAGLALESLPPAPEEVFCAFDEGSAFFGSEEAPFDEFDEEVRLLARL
jgi:hypothetical protein